MPIRMPQRQPNELDSNPAGSENQGLSGTRQHVDAPSRPLERVFESLDFKSRDRLTELYDHGQTIDQICQTTSYSRDTMLHTLSCGFFNEGRIDLAELLARESLSERLCPDMHNQLLRCLLASPRDTRQEFFDESLRRRVQDDYWTPVGEPRYFQLPFHDPWLEKPYIVKFDGSDKIHFVRESHLVAESEWNEGRYSADSVT